jgi:hypothetical protein
VSEYELCNGIEIWWTNRTGRHYRVFTNANFLYLTGIGDFEDDQARYSTFMLVMPRDRSLEENGPWRPTVSDFTAGEFEYYIVEPNLLTSADQAAFAGIEAMIAHFSENSNDLKTAYENRLKLQQAKRAYDTANPRVDHDVIINYAPLRGEAAQ